MQGSLHLSGMPEVRMRRYKQLSLAGAKTKAEKYERMVIEVENFRFSVTERVEWRFAYWMHFSNREWRELVDKFRTKAETALSGSHDPRFQALFERTSAMLDGQLKGAVRTDVVGSFRETDSILGIVNATRDFAQHLVESGNTSQACELLRQSTLVSQLIGDQPGRCKAFARLAYFENDSNARRIYRQLAIEALETVQWSQELATRIRDRWLNRRHK
jgi:hypothetical protein